MRILLANHHLLQYGGTENFTFTAASGLMKQGHQVTVYSRYIGTRLRRAFAKARIPLVSDLSPYRATDFDIAHVHHNICAIEVRHHLPTVPIFFLSHGSAQFLEMPAAIDLNIALYGVVGQHIAAKLRQHGIPDTRIVTFHNICDEAVYRSSQPISPKPKRVLVLSAKTTPGLKDTITRACRILKLRVTFLGGKKKHVSAPKVTKYIKEADLVITLGRGAMEAMLCGRIPLIYDIFGGDGLVTATNFQKLLARNFTGMVKRKKYSVTDLVKIIEQYDPAESPLLEALAYQHFSIAKQIPRLVDIYTQTIKLHDTDEVVNEPMIRAFISTIKQTEYQTAQSLSLKHPALEYKHQLEHITSSKLYKLWPMYTKLKALMND